MRIVNKYFVKLKPVHEPKVVGDFIQSFTDGWVRDITRATFSPFPVIYAHIYLVDGCEATLVFRAQPPIAFIENWVELQNYTDIPMLPLMDVGITASKQANG